MTKTRVKICNPKTRLLVKNQTLCQTTHSKWYLVKINLIILKLNKRCLNTIRLIQYKISHRAKMILKAVMILIVLAKLLIKMINRVILKILLTIAWTIWIQAMTEQCKSNKKAWNFWCNFRKHLSKNKLKDSLFNRNRNLIHLMKLIRKKEMGEVDISYTRNRYSTIQSNHKET
jgi:hypothetical protein